MYSILGWACALSAVWSVNEWDSVPLGLVFFAWAVIMFRAARGIRPLGRLGAYLDRIEERRRQIAEDDEEEESEDFEILEDSEDEEDEEEAEPEAVQSRPKTYTAAERLENVREAEQRAREAERAERRLVLLLDKRERMRYGAGDTEEAQKRLEDTKAWRLLEYDIMKAERILAEYK